MNTLAPVFHINTLDRIFALYTFSRGSPEAVEMTLRYLQTNFILVQTQIQDSGLVEILSGIYPFLHSQSLVDIVQEIAKNRAGDNFHMTISRELIYAQNQLKSLGKIREQFLEWSGDEIPEPEPDAANSINSVGLLVLLIWIVTILV